MVKKYLGYVIEKESGKRHKLYFMKDECDVYGVVMMEVEAGMFATGISGADLLEVASVATKIYHGDSGHFELFLDTAAIAGEVENINTRAKNYLDRGESEKIWFLHQFLPTARLLADILAEEDPEGYNKATKY